MHQTNTVKNEIEGKKNFKKACDSLKDAGFSKDEVNQCKEVADAIQDFKLSNGQDLNSKMSSISKKTEFLYYMDLYSEEHTVDFNNLKAQMAVFVVSFSMS